MANYRGIVRHVRYWRGQPHRWSTAYEFSGTLSKPLDLTACQDLLTADDAMCFGVAAADGGTYYAAIYNTASGGVPVASYTRFDWTNTATWIAYSKSAWGGLTGSFNNPAEAALSVKWPAGISKSGKPVFMRKWFHAVPTSGSATGQTGDIPAAQVTSLTTGATTLQGCLSSYGLSLAPKSTGIPAGSPIVSAFYGNHQMPRGRRRKPLVKADGQYTGPSISIGPQLAGSLPGED